MSRVGSTALQNPPSLIEHGKLRFMIMDSPTDENLHLYLGALESHDVGTWVRACEAASYNDQTVAERGISLHHLSFPDGEAPPKPLIDQWLDLCFADEKTVAVHCVAGLGRAPLLVSLALIESGLDAMDAVELIRKRRRGAINRVQLKWVQDYKPSRRKKEGCAVM